LNDDALEALEISALLHDIGKLGLPDRILRKPGKLDAEDRVHVERARQRTVEIVAPMSRSPAVIKYLHYASAWYDGSRQQYDLKGDALPIGARMIAIVDAFDAMTTEQVYRRAMSQERAMAELFEFAGFQFDPAMVQDFCRLLSSGKISFESAVADRWLRKIKSSDSNTHWGGNGTSRPVVTFNAPARTLEDELKANLIEHMADGVVLFDEDMVVRSWNPAAHRLTGIAASSIENKQFLPSVVNMLDEKERPIDDDQCPVVAAIQEGTPQRLKFHVVDMSGRVKLVRALVVPKTDEKGQSRGAAMLLHDGSSQADLEERVQELHVRATLDGLTKVLNRAEFERIHEEVVKAYLRDGRACSLMICDIDFFKKINDVHGH
jgi:PAS domain S-box-containing protein